MAVLQPALKDEHLDQEGRRQFNNRISKPGAAASRIDILQGPRKVRFKFHSQSFYGLFELLASSNQSLIKQIAIWFSIENLRKGIIRCRGRHVLND